MFVQKGAHVRDRSGANAEHFPNVRVNGQVCVALPITRLRVGQPAVHVARGIRLPERERAQRLGEQRDGACPHRDLARTGAENVALDPNDVAQVEQLDQLIGLIADFVPPEVELHPPGTILEMRERRLPMASERDETTGEAHGPVCVGIEAGQRLRGGVGPLIAVGERVDATLAQAL